MCLDIRGGLLRRMNEWLRGTKSDQKLSVREEDEHHTQLYLTIHIKYNII